MKRHLFQVLNPNVEENARLREPQKAAYAKLKAHFSGPGPAREVGIILPVGCGKSGLITLAPFAVRAQRALVIAPGTNIADQLFQKDFDPGHDEFFYRARGVLTGDEYPEAAEIRGQASNLGDLDAADVVITNVQQLQGEDNRWLLGLPPDFFDLILVDEGHHNVAASWVQIRDHFPDAKVVNLSATPTRADGRVMAGQIIYSYPVVEAIAAGYVKRLKAVVLNPSTLRFVREEGGAEVEVSSEEVRRLGESDADFRRSIVNSKETLATIVDVSIQRLKRLRKDTGEGRHKLIVSALNHKHCIQIAEAFRARNMRVEHVHSNEDGAANTRVLKKLENHELDGIVQVRKLGEGFDHRWLSVAVVCNIFANLSPFVQFIGRVMRAVDQGAPGSPNNQGIVVFHAGANVAKRWDDFKDFSGADQDYFDKLLPTEEIPDFACGDEVEIEPDPAAAAAPAITIVGQTDVSLEEDELVPLDAEQQMALDLLLASIGPDQLIRHATLQRLTPRKQDQRRAAQKALDDEVKNGVGRLMARRKINPKARDLDKKYLGRENFKVLKAAADRTIAGLVGRPLGKRGELTHDEIERVRARLDDVLSEVETEVVGPDAAS